jgi:pentatricopeptide repeat protein
VIHSLAESGQFELAMSGLNSMMGSGVQPTVATFDGLLRSCIRQHQGPVALQLVQIMNAHGLQPRPTTQEALMHLPLARRAERRTCRRRPTHHPLSCRAARPLRPALRWSPRHFVDAPCLRVPAPRTPSGAPPTSAPAE